MQDASQIVDMTPWVSVIGAMVGWTAFLILVAMFKNFIVTGFSVFVADLIWKSTNEATRNKLVRKLANSEKVIEALKELKEQEG